MNDILAALEQVRDREASAALLVDEARRKAKELVAAADEAGREEFRGMVASAEEEARLGIAAAETEAAAMKARVREETDAALKQLDAAGERLFEDAVTLLLRECERIYGPGGPGYDGRSKRGA